MGEVKRSLGVILREQQQTDSATPLRAHRARRSGVRLTKAERERAQDIFLGSFSRNANVMAACREAGVNRSTFYQWQEHDEKFALRYHQAEADAEDVIRAAIYTRGINGWLEPVVSMGRVVLNEDGTPLMVRKYSDSLALALALARARLPEFREKVEVSATLDINTLAAEADAKFYSIMAAVEGPPDLGPPDADTEE